MGRAKDRKGEPDEWHFWMLDEDTERTEAKIDKVVSDLAQLKWYAVGILVSLTTASVLLLLQRASG